MSLRFRLNLTIVLILFLILSMSAIFVVHYGRRAVTEEIRSSVDLALRLVDAGIQERPRACQDISRWLTPLARSQKTRHLRIAVIRNDGESVAPPASEPGASHAPAWFARLVAPTPRWIERLCPEPDGQIMRVIIQADPQDEIAEVWEESQGFLALIGVLAIAIYATVHVVLGRAFRSVDLILKGLEGIEAGNFAARLPKFPLPEFSIISAAFNHTAAALEKARAENRALTQRSLAIQEDERRYIAQELHDELGQSVSAIKVMAVSVRAGETRPEALRALSSITHQCDRLFQVVRDLMRRLRPVMLEELGLTASLEDLIEYWRARHPGVRVDFHCEPAVEACAGDAKIHLFRIVQECLTNAARHAAAHALRIRLTASGDTGRSVRLEFADDGKGFDPATPALGFGLAGIRERAASMGGQFHLDTRPGEGVRLLVTLPCKQPYELYESNARLAGG